MSVLHPRRLKKTELVEQRIAVVLAEVGPLLRIDHCHIEVARYSAVTGSLTIRVEASCDDCELSPATFMPAIEAHLKQRVPEVREVLVAAQ
jgi:Fe-S cluster biogenesis protein NfuA